MKRISFALSLLALGSIFLTGCLKDKGFENGEYGLNDPDTQKPGVGFPLATKSQGFGLNVSGSSQVVTEMAFINLNSGPVASSDVKVTLTNNTTSMVAAYNTANNLTGSNQVLELPTSLYTFATTATIPTGGRFIDVPITVSSTLSLDPARAYAVGISISAVDGGYTIASNMKDLFIIFSIKNRLDGIYEITGEALRAGDPLLSGFFGPYERAYSTSGPNAVQHNGQVLWANTGNSALPGGYEPLVTVDPTTNLITSVSSPAGIYMTAPIVRTDIVGSAHRYDVATKTLYFEFSYGGGPTSRLFSIKAVYKRPR